MIKRCRVREGAAARTRGACGGRGTALLLARAGDSDLLRWRIGPSPATAGGRGRDAQDSGRPSRDSDSKHRQIGAGRAAGEAGPTRTRLQSRAPVRRAPNPPVITIRVAGAFRTASNPRSLPRAATAPPLQPPDPAALARASPGWNTLVNFTSSPQHRRPCTAGACFQRFRIESRGPSFRSWKRAPG